MPPDLFDAVLMAGLPVAAITFALFAWAYRTGKVIPRDDWLTGGDTAEDETDWGLSGDLGLSQDATSNDAGNTKATASPSNGYIMDKWVEFGGGYYGLMTTLTFFYLEFKELLGLGELLKQFDGIESLINTLLEFGIQMLVEAFTNLVDAFLWWDYWPDQLPIANGSGFWWLGVSYAGYLAGEWLAGFFRKNTALEATQ